MLDLRRTVATRAQVMLGSCVSDVVLMRYVDDELPWVLRIPVRAAIMLSPRLRRRVVVWRKLSHIVASLDAGADESLPRPGPHLVPGVHKGVHPADQRSRKSWA